MSTSPKRGRAELAAALSRDRSAAGRLAAAPKSSGASSALRWGGYVSGGPGPPPGARSSRLRWAWWLLAYASLGLGLVGVLVPGLPTVPFVLLSAYAAAR
ncbi:MAG: DUF454 family protein, partial [Proteobacteria bacterium]|nr:DUF454 family protein [Pseudomonadota bacterium]